jgi:hypothetical protein
MECKTASVPQRRKAALGRPQRDGADRCLKSKYRKGERVSAIGPLTFFAGMAEGGALRNKKVLGGGGHASNGHDILG